MEDQSTCMSRLDCALADITHAHQYLSELWRIPCGSIGRYLADALLNVMYYIMYIICRLPEGRCNECGMSIPLGSEVYPDKAARREIASLEVCCPHNATGCQWTGKLSTVEEHADQCQHKGVQCTNKGCEVVTTVAQLEEHMKNCLFRETQCPHCNCTLPLSALEVSCDIGGEYIGNFPLS